MEANPTTATQPPLRKRPRPAAAAVLLGLCALSAATFARYDRLLASFSVPDGGGSSSVRVLRRATKAAADEEGRRRLDQDAEARAYMNKRIMEVFRTTWPECVNQHMTAIQCKSFIDEDIISTFTGRDKYIRVIIKGKRRKYDTWYNTVVIVMNDADMATGIDGDGLVQYDFEWESSGTEATAEQQSEIPPVLATETAAGSPQTAPQDEPITDPSDPNYVPEADPTNEVEYEPLIIEEEPVLVEGANLTAALEGTATDPIAGGVVVDPSTPNTPEGDVKLDAAIDDYNVPPPPAPEAGTDDAAGSGTLPDAGARELPTFDCDGLTGYNCCLMIKMMVPDADVMGKAIQCRLIYQEGSNKDKFWFNSRGKKVFVFANHNEFVSKIPKIVGNWPKGVGDFDQWLADGGDPNQVYG